MSTSEYLAEPAKGVTWKCPHCGNTTAFRVEVEIPVDLTVHASGQILLEVDAEDAEWKDDSFCLCLNEACGAFGAVKDFNVDESSSCAPPADEQHSEPQDEKGASLYPTDTCGCGYELIYTVEGWQHNVAPYLWGDDHDPQPYNGLETKATRKYDIEHCDEHRPDDSPEPGDRCKYCGVELTWIGPSTISDWEPVDGWEESL